MAEKKLTIFTPTYNRAYILPQLYNSLCQQSCKDFFWLVIDDGSTDNTPELMEMWEKEGNINITYIYQKNGGKMRAHNKAVKLCETELFFCVDSDDYLTDNAVEIIKKCWERHFDGIGILAKKGKNVNKSWTQWDGKIVYQSMYDAQMYNGLMGDTALIFRTEIIKKVAFPDFEGEKFVPEAYLYDALSRIGKMYFLNKIVCISGYLPDGYTNNIRKINANNPRGYLAYIQQRLKMDKNLRQRLMDTIRYVAIKSCIKKESIIKDAEYPLLTVLMYPFGKLFYYKNYRKFI